MHLAIKFILRDDANIQNRLELCLDQVNHVASREKEKGIVKLKRGYYGARKTFDRSEDNGKKV